MTNFSTPPSLGFNRHWQVAGLLWMLLFFFASPLIAQTVEDEDGPGISVRAAEELEKIKDPNTGKVPEGAYWQALMQTKQATEFYLNTAARNSALSWIERGPNSDVVGPSNGNTRANSAVTSGRMRAMMVDAADATGKTVWVGGVDGGLWSTTDITASPANWTLVNDYLSNLAVTDIVQDPTNYNIMYFCTGEAYGNGDAVQGNGVFKSTDHGATWSYLTSTSNYVYCTRIKCDYLGNVYLATRYYGLLRSSDGGLTWTTITPSGLSANICDLEISSTTGPARLHVVAGIFSTQAYRYTDIPSTVTSASGWNAPSVAFPSYSQRAEIGCSGNVLYACPVDANYQVPTIYKSTDGGATWTATAAQPTAGWASQQGWYSLSVVINPTNSDICIVGGLDNWKTTNGGASWTKISSWYGTSGQYVHADQHDALWYDNGNKLLFACDGGIHFSADGGTTIRDRNVGLRLKQFYSVAVHPTSADYFLAGAQDNGTHKLSSPGLGSSVEVTGGDGAFVAIDQNQPQYQFGAYVYNQYRRSTDGGNSWSSINFSSSAGRFINPFDYDNVNNKLYASWSPGYYFRWENPQTGSTSATVAVAAFGGSAVSAVKVSPYTSNLVYFGTTAGAVVKAENANTASPTVTAITPPGTSGYYTSCMNTGTSDSNLMVCYSNYNVNNIWVSADGGVTWTNIDGDLPNMPVRWCMFEPGNNTAAIIATETGVWETSQFNGAGTHWIPSLNFPKVRTDMLAYRSSDKLLAAGTHGRGVFSTNVVEPNPCTAPLGLASTNITYNGATLRWASVSNATTYNVDYRQNGGINWNNAATALADTTVNLGGLLSSTLYEWRVRATCDTLGNSTYSTAQFTTAPMPTCYTPTGLSATGITPTSATLNWAAAVNAVSYDVDYKVSSSGTWINAVSGTTSLTFNLTGLTHTTTYDYRVRTNCSFGNSSYAQAQFTTTSCFTPTGLNASAVSTTTATVNWSVAVNAVSYSVDYKPAASGVWVSAAVGTVATSVNLTGLTPSTLYDYRVVTNCNFGSSAFAQAQFTTASTCPGPLDVSTNGIYTGAAVVPFNTDVLGTIATSTDVDYYKFTITVGGTVTITLTTLPANYDITLFNSTGTKSVGSSAMSGTANESLFKTLTPGDYYVKVFGKGSAFNATSCYTLKVQLGTAMVQEPLIPMNNENTVVKLYPNPANTELNVSTDEELDETATLKILNLEGKVMYIQAFQANPQSIDVSTYAPGFYYIQVHTSQSDAVYKFIKE